MTVAQRIVDNIAQHNFLMDEEHINMTISAGLSEYPNDSDKLFDLIQYADEGLYKTKDLGGDGVQSTPLNSYEILAILNAIYLIFYCNNLF